jgi:cytochrome c551/c552
MQKTTQTLLLGIGALAVVAVIGTRFYGAKTQDAIPPDARAQESKPVQRPGQEAKNLAAETSAGAHAIVHEIVLPAEQGSWRDSTLPGRQLASQKCTICHSIDYIDYQPPGMNLEKWTGEVAKMQRAFGAPLDDTEIKSIGAYLAVAYGSAQETDEAVLLASVAPEREPGQGGADDVQMLLNANGCLGCHAVDKKVVGPAYRDVAARYKGDDQALAKVTAGIRKGGAERWGDVPMPAMPNLTEEQAQLLAAFVLQQ